MNDIGKFLSDFEHINYGIVWTAYQHSYCPLGVLDALCSLRSEWGLAV